MELENNIKSIGNQILEKIISNNTLDIYKIRVDNFSFFFKFIFYFII